MSDILASWADLALTALVCFAAVCIWAGVAMVRRFRRP